ncbi:MAG: pilus assembly PilX N-terminal domain-containing protein [Candidatus Saccharibacteria bacterium]|nr:pilus assembly PilX N-terminal domain-containing protein [Candidatus Saccharibacteria bacterium]
MRKENSIKTKRGITSIFVTVIIILILGVVTASFLRLTTSEASQSSNNDLSQSAYDSAQAGIEDAKIALLQYHDCLSAGGATSSEACKRIVPKMQQGIRDKDCDTIANALGREVKNGGVNLQATKSGSDDENALSMLQAYTCVTVEEELDDYRTTLDSSNSFRIIPIRPASGDINSIDTIEVSWFSPANKEAAGYSNYCNNESLYSITGCNSKYLAPPVLGVGLIQTDESFALSELTMANSSDKSNRGQLYFKPINRADASPTTISASVLSSTANGSVYAKSNGSDNPGVYNVSCSASKVSDYDGFYCRARVGIPKPFNGGNRNVGSFFLLVSLPYTKPDTDISVRAFRNSSPISLVGVQARVDSTGRANDLYRRIEVRLELVDTYFPYPQYEIQMSEDADAIEKSFRVSKNCWWTDFGGMAKDGCDNYVENLNLSTF